MSSPRYSRALITSMMAVFIPTEVRIVGLGDTDRLAVLQGCPGIPGASGPKGEPGLPGTKGEATEAGNECEMAWMLGVQEAETGAAAGLALASVSHWRAEWEGKTLHLERCPWSCSFYPESHLMSEAVLGCEVS